MTQPWVSYALFGCCAFGILYLVVAFHAFRRFSAIRQGAPEPRPLVTVLKPLCGDEPGLYENLLSFCDQLRGSQVVFGARDASDPAADVARAVIRDRPEADLSLVLDGRSEGFNRKVCSLQSMMKMARHEILVLADSDIRVRPGYLSDILQPLTDRRVGVVTCPFYARPVGGGWSRLRAMWFNHAFLPSVLFTRLVGRPCGCFGSTIVIRRETLDRIGGFAALRDQLADDWAIGAAVRRLGLRVVISHHWVESLVHEPDLRALLQHELRWGRTLRGIAPFGYAASVVTNPVALSVLGWAASGPSLAWTLLVAVALAIRLWMARSIDRTLGVTPAAPWLVPLRDLLSLVLHVACLWGSKVVWRERGLRVASGGRLVAEESS